MLLDGLRLISRLGSFFRFMIIDEPDIWDCELVPWRVHTFHFGKSSTVGFTKRSPTSFPVHKSGDTNALMDFE